MGSDYKVQEALKTAQATASKPPLRFNAREWSGAFGDIGTDLPLLLGIILASGMSGAWVFLLFGLAQWATALYFRIPMPVQPLKAMAVIIIAQQLPADIILGGALSVALLMLLLTATGLVQHITALIPLAVVRGIQCALGIKLCWLAATNYLPALGAPGLWAALMAAGVLLLGRWWVGFPMAPLALLGGVIFGLFYLGDGVMSGGAQASGPATLGLSSLSLDNILTGLVVLALPQLPLSLSNAMVATQRTLQDFYPERRVSIPQLGYSYAAHNSTAALLGGIPVCHGAGGLAGHYAFGGRTGGSVLIYGVFYVLLGLLVYFTQLQFVQVLFPLPILGVLLLFEGGVLCKLLTRVPAMHLDRAVAVAVVLMALSLPQGFIMALTLGAFFYHAAHLGRRFVLNPQKETQA